MKSIILRVFLSLILFLGVAELATRVLFWNGESFGSRVGPIPRRFERNFHLNGFEHSRGPAVSGAKQPGAVRVLVQGDSISWGQGIADERQVYPARLLEMLRGRNRNVEMLVLAEPGREIDWHYQEIVKYGVSIQPDVIIYQWYMNDLELETKSDRPTAQPLWRRVFLNWRFLPYSYFLSFADVKAGQLLPMPRSYEDYLLEKFERDTSDWRKFIDMFRQWAQTSRQLTRRVAVVLYPALSSPEGRRLVVLNEKVAALCGETGVAVLDLTEALNDLQGNVEAVSVSRYDDHPNAMVHERMARAVFEDVTTLWPDAWQAPADGSAVSPRPPGVGTLQR